MTRIPAAWFACLLLLTVLPAAGAAQTATTSLRGTVSDASNAVIPGARVVLLNRANGQQVSRSTGAGGEFNFPQLTPGTYTITTTHAGFAPRVAVATLLINQPATVNVTLTVQQSQQEVQVSATAETLNTANASLGSAVGNSTIQALPMEGRNVPGLLALQPGVLYLGNQTDQQQQTDSRSGAVAGVRSDQTNVSLDGVDDNDQLYGYAFKGVLRSTLDSVEEFRVSTTMADASSGGAGGAQVVMITKSGANKMHGSAYEYLRNTATSANDFFNKNAQLASGEPNKPGELNRNTFGVSVGGPIRKNKLFYFVNYEGQRTSENQQVTRVVPTASFRAGTIQYRAADGSTVTLDPGQIAAMDPGCGGNGTCPWGAGNDPNVLTLLSKYPQPNGSAGGDLLNTASYTWSAQDPGHLNTTIAKMDWLPSDTNRVFLRGNFQRDGQLGVPELPGQPASTDLITHAGGAALGDTWTISPTMINNLRFGYITETIANAGLGNDSFVNFGNNLSSPVAQTSTSTLTMPTSNLVDDVTWIKGSHTLQFGANYRLTRIGSVSNATSYDNASMGIGLLYQARIANTGSTGSPTNLDPTTFGYPVVANGFTSSYDNDIMALTGLISYLQLNSNYMVNSGGQSSSLLPVGAMIPRNFMENDFESYAQDTWQLRRNLTVVAGVRYSLDQTPYETNGQQVAPDISMDQWFKTRQVQAALGNSVQPPFSFTPSGKVNGGKPFWPMNKFDLAPRLSVALSPGANAGFWHALFGKPSTSSLRVGGGLYYQRYGAAIADSFSQSGSFGLTSTITNPQNIWTVDNAPRLTCLTCIPTALPTPIPPSPQTQAYPVTPPQNIYGSGFAIADGIDDNLKTPYTLNLDASFQRELPHGFTLEIDYVGTFGHNLLQRTDMAQPLDLVDPKSGMDYFTAAKPLSQAALQGKATVAAIPYWEDMFPAAAGMAPDGQVQSATQNIYQYLWAGEAVQGNEVGGIGTLDALCLPLAPPQIGPVCGGTPGSYSRYWPLQYSSLNVWDTIGRSRYQSLEFVVHHPASHGLQMDFSYTYGHSFDMGSDDERASLPGGSAQSHIINAWEPNLNWGPSDFDIHHNITADWVYNLPFGRGQALAGHAGGVLEALLGNWQLSGLGRWTSGLPFSVYCGPGWTTSWNYQSYCMQTGAIPTGLYYDSTGSPMAFSDPVTLQDALASGTPWRRPYAGEVGSRNNFRGQGLFDLDASLGKTFQLSEAQSLEFRWDTFNVTNTVRFDTNSIDNVSSDGSLGVYGATLSKPRVMQFSLRYSF